jgi:hypothetical protein
VEFIHKTFVYYENKSEIAAMAENSFRLEPKVTKAHWADAQVMARTDWIKLKLKKQGTASQVFVPSRKTYCAICGDEGDNMTITAKKNANAEKMKLYMIARHRSATSRMEFDDHMQADKSHYKLAPLLPEMEKKHIFFECECDEFRREFACWHALYLSLKAGKTEVPRGMSIKDIGERPGPGATRRMTGALTMDITF